jgi:hypothetical protein
MVNFQTKNHNFVNFGLSCNGRCWYILRIYGLFYIQPFHNFYCHLVYFVVIWDIFSVLVYFTKKNLATLILSRDFLSWLGGTLRKT